MRPGRRALLGAAIGALIVLFAHPATRPAFLSPFRRIPSGGLSALLQPRRLVEPNDLVSGAAFLHMGAERLIEGPPLLPEERRTLLDITSEGARMERENAFWPQARFLFGSDKTARTAWTAASRCHTETVNKSGHLGGQRARNLTRGRTAATHSMILERASDLEFRARRPRPHSRAEGWLDCPG